MDKWHHCVGSHRQSVYVIAAYKHLDICRLPSFVCWFLFSVPSMQAAAAPSTQLDDLSQNTAWLRKIKAGCSWLANCFDNKFKQLVSGNILEDMDLWEKTIMTIRLEGAIQSCCFDAVLQIVPSTLLTMDVKTTSHSVWLPSFLFFS